MFSSLLVPTFYGGYGWLNQVYQVLPPILYAILGVVGAAGSVYAIILGINLAKADSDDKRKTAATRLRNTLFGVATLIVLVVFINVLLPLILEAVLPKYNSGDVRAAEGLTQQAAQILNNIKMMIKM